MNADGNRDPSVGAFLRDFGTVFHQPWWLDAVTQEVGWQWSCAISRKSDRIRAVWPYVWHKVLRHFVLIEMPKLTPYLGPVFAPLPGKATTQLAEQKDIYDELLGQMPPYAHFKQCFTPDVTNWIPLYWKNFTQTTYYTYTFRPQSDGAVLYTQLRENIRRDLKKARNLVEIVETTDFEHLIRLHHLTLNRQNKVWQHRDDFVRALERVARTHSASRILIAIDAQKRVHSAGYFLTDKNHVHALLSGGDPALRESGAGALLYWEAIQQAGREEKIYDFGGSMIEPIEFFLRGFGGTQTPYFVVSHKNPQLLLRARTAFWAVRTSFRRHLTLSKYTQR